MTEAKTKSDQTSLSLDLQINNSDLSSLVGPLDSNLAQLENFLNVEISRRGASFGIKGTQANCRKAIQALTDLAAIAERKSDELTAEDIQLYLVGQNAPAEELAAEEPVPELRTNRKGLQGRTPMQRTYIRNILSHDVSFGIGPAGTGKTYLAVAAAVSAFEKGEVERIVLTRPAVEAGEKLGFLPGDMKDKIDPYLQPLYDALQDMIPAAKLKEYMELNIIQIAPLAFMRGRTLNDAVVILDEAQNTTTQQIKMFLTRMGMNTKMIVTGDMTQIDLPSSQTSGLVQAMKILKGVKGISFIELNKKDIVRHKLVTRIVEAYEKFEEKEKAERVKTKVKTTTTEEPNK